MKLFFNEETMEIEAINIITERKEKTGCEKITTENFKNSFKKLQKMKIILHQPKFAPKVFDDGFVREKEEPEEKKDDSSVSTNYWWYIGIMAIPIILIGNLMG